VLDPTADVLKDKRNRKDKRNSFAMPIATSLLNEKNQTQS